MLNLKNNENKAVFDEICKIAKIKIKFQKMKRTFLDSILWLKSHQPLMIDRHLIEILTKKLNFLKNILILKHVDSYKYDPQKNFTFPVTFHKRESFLNPNKQLAKVESVKRPLIRLL